MKKLLIIVLLSIIFVSCEGNNGEKNSAPEPQVKLDFLSMRDAERDVIVSIGVGRNYLVEALGQPFKEDEIKDENNSLYLTGNEVLMEFNNGMMVALQNDAVYYIAAFDAFDNRKFEIYGHSASMTPQETAADMEFQEDLSALLSEQSGGEAFVFLNHFDKNGERQLGLPLTFAAPEGLVSHVVDWSRGDSSVQDNIFLQIFSGL